MKFGFSDEKPYVVGFVSGHSFSRATKPFIFVILRGFSRERSALLPTATNFSAACLAAVGT
jgi:hypothetical protein